jgi:hypothetical protein
VAAEIHRDAERLDGLLDDLLEEDEGEGTADAADAAPVPAAAGEVVAAGSR